MFPTDAQRGLNPTPHQHRPPQPGDRKLAFGQLRQAVSARLCDLLDDAGIHATRVVSGRRFVRWDTVPKLLAQKNVYISGLPYEFFFAKPAPTTTVNDNSPTSFDDEDPNDNNEEMTTVDVFTANPALVHTLIAQLHAQPLNINILSWKKQTIERILDGLDKHRIRVAPRPQARDVVFEIEIGPAGGGGGTTEGGTAGPAVHSVDVPKWPDVYPRPAQNESSDTVTFPPGAHGYNGGNGNNANGPGPVRNARPDRERRRRLSTNTNASNTTGSTGSEVTTSSTNDQKSPHAGTPTSDHHQRYSSGAPTDNLMMPRYAGSTEYTESGHLDGNNPRHSHAGHASHAHANHGYGSEPLLLNHNSNSTYDAKGSLGHERHHGPSSRSIRTEVAATPVVHNHTLTPLPFRPYSQERQQYPQPPFRHADPPSFPSKNDSPPTGSRAGTGTGGHQHVSRPIIQGSPTKTTSSSNTSTRVGAGVNNTPATTATTFLTTPTPTKKWTRRSSPDRIYMNITLNGILRSAGMPIPRQKDDASRLPWSSIPQFLAENGLYVRGWPEANLPWLYSGDMPAVKGAAPSSHANATGHGSHGAGGAGGMGEWRDRIDWKSSPSQRSYKPLAQALRNGEIQILPRPPGRDVLFEVRDAQGRCYDSTLGLSDEWKAKWMQDALPDTKFVDAATVSVTTAAFEGLRRRPEPLDMLSEDGERERGRPGYHSRSTSYSRDGERSSVPMDLELPSPTETTASSSSGTTKRHVQQQQLRGGYQSLAYPPEHQPKPHSSFSASFPPYHDAHTPPPRRLTPPITSSDRHGTIRFPQHHLSRHYSENFVRMRPTESPSNNESRKNTPSPNSSQRQRTVSLGTSSASTTGTGTGTALSGSSSSGFSTTAVPIRPGAGAATGGPRYNLPSLSHGIIDTDMDMDNPTLNRLPPLLMHPKSELDGDGDNGMLALPSARSSPTRGGDFTSGTPPALLRGGGLPSALSLPTHFPSPVVAFSQPMWSATERTWKLIVLDPSRASLPPVGDIILWEAERRSWRLTWSVEAMGNSGLKLPSAVWSAKQEAWILES